MSYLGEFKAHWHNLLGAALGIGFGAAMNHYMTNLFAPPLLAEFGWEKSHFALIGVMPLATMAVLPLQGRFTDRFGARVAAGVGVVVLPLTFIAYSMMSGNILEFFAIAFVQALVGMLVGTLCYTRVVVEKFDAARGFALSLCMTGAPVIGGILTPIVGATIDEEGWRAGYRLLAIISAVGGLAALILIGRSKVMRRAPGEVDPNAPHLKPTGTFLQDLRSIARQPAFALMVAGMFFCNFPQVLAGSQLKLVVMDSGAPSMLATWIVSLYATGVVIGRVVSGLALDRIPAHHVAILALGLPAIGFLALASSFDAPWVLGGAILLIGLAQGGEGDIASFLTSRNFDMRQYSFVFSFVASAMFVASAVGSVTLSLTLGQTGSYNLFLSISALMTLVGALAFFLTGWARQAHPEAHEAAVAPEGPIRVLAGEEI
ncbi:MAG: MFS transporter [Novosphingobium sp.]|nr:MFS transporter [Novosphingobium sp.]